MQLRSVPRGNHKVVARAECQGPKPIIAPQEVADAARDRGMCFQSKQVGSGFSWMAGCWRARSDGASRSAIVEVHAVPQQLLFQLRHIGLTKALTGW